MNDPMSNNTSMALGSVATLVTDVPAPDPSKLNTGRRDTPEATAKAASQFESLLIGQFLKTAREAGGSGWMGTDSQDADEGMIELAEQQLSQALSARGGFGLAKLITEGLTKAERTAEAGATKSQ
jgi:Rod binding domain-containing protein